MERAVERGRDRMYERGRERQTEGMGKKQYLKR